MNHLPSLTLSATQVAFSLHPRLWVLHNNGDLRRLDLSDAKVERRHMKVPFADDTVAMAARPDGQLLALCDQEGLRLVEYPLAGGDLIDLPYPNISALAFSPDGRWLALATVEDGVYMLDAMSYTEEWKAPYAQYVRKPRLSFSNDSATLAVNTGDTISRFESKTGDPLKAVEVPRRELFDFAVNTKHTHWGIAVYSGEEVYTLTPFGDEQILGRGLTPAPVTALVQFDDERLWVATVRGEIIEIEPSLRTIYHHPSDGEDVAYQMEVSADGAHLVTLWTDGKMRLFGTLGA